MKFFDFEGGFTRLTGKIFDLLLLSLLWVIGCLPVITIGTSTAALYRAVVKSVKQNDGYGWKVFLRAYRENFKKTVLMWFILGTAGFLLQWNIGILIGETDGYLGLFLICLYFFAFLLLIPFFFYWTAAVTTFEMKLGWLVKLSAYMVVRYLPVTVGLYAAVFCFGALIYRFPFLLLVLPGAFILVISDLMEKVLFKHAL